MKKWVGIAAVIISVSTCTYADDQQSIEQGVKNFDWQACIDQKLGECMTACETSEDISCKDNCNTMAADKCKSQGLQPAQ